MLGLGLSRYLPPALRRLVLARATRFGRDRELFKYRTLPSWLAARQLLRLRRRPRPAFRGTNVAVIGFHSSRIGLGRGADLLARELASAGAAVHRIDVTRALGLEANVACPECKPLEVLADPSVTDIVMYLNPPEVYRVLTLLEPAWFETRCVAGYFLWELSRLPPWWHPAIRSLDEIWVASQFVCDLVRQAQPSRAPPVRIKPPLVDATQWRPATVLERNEARRALGIPQGAFVALCSFSMASSLARKNPMAAIESFRSAFVQDSGALLIVRCLDHSVYPDGAAQLRAAATGDDRIRVVLEEGAKTSLRPYYRAADALVTLHRGEGFGLNIAEALAMELPVVATAWTLNEAFLAHPLMHAVGSRQVPVVDPQHIYDVVPGGTWAEPALDDAANALKLIAACRGFPVAPSEGSGPASTPYAAGAGSASRDS